MSFFNWRSEFTEHSAFYQCLPSIAMRILLFVFFYSCFYNNDRMTDWMLLNIWSCFSGWPWYEGGVCNSCVWICWSLSGPPLLDVIFPLLLFFIHLLRISLVFELWSPPPTHKINKIKIHFQTRAASKVIANKFRFNYMLVTFVSLL